MALRLLRNNLDVDQPHSSLKTDEQDPPRNTEITRASDSLDLVNAQSDADGTLYERLISRDANRNAANIHLTERSYRPALHHHLGKDFLLPMYRDPVFFQPGDGIDRAVITADIQRYLGPGASVKPGSYDKVEGYWISAHRPLTSAQVMDLRSDSARWSFECSRDIPIRESQASAPQYERFASLPQSVYDNMMLPCPGPDRAAYQDSQTHYSRQHYGPTSSSPRETSYATHQPQKPVVAYGNAYGHPYQQKMALDDHQDLLPSFTCGLSQIVPASSLTSNQSIQAARHQEHETELWIGGYPTSSGRRTAYLAELSNGHQVSYEATPLGSKARGSGYQAHKAKIRERRTLITSHANRLKSPE